MKAAAYTTYGSTDVLQIAEIEKPIPNENELLIKVHAAEVTKGDCELRKFRFPVKWTTVPLRLAFGLFKPRKQILGGYFSGEVERIGKDVSAFKAGDQVFGSCGFRFGAHSQYVCLTEKHTIITKPRNTSFAEAAAVPLGGLNALHFMRRANIQQGDTVLISGAGGSIGIYGIQLAKAMGASTVTAVDHPDKESLLRSIGADHFIDYTNVDFTQTENSYDVIFNMVAGTYAFNACFGMLNPGGRYLHGNPSLSDMLRSAFVSKNSDKKAIVAFASESREELLTLKDMIEKNQLKPIVDQVYPLNQIQLAHQKVETEERLGCIIVAPHL